MATSLPKGSQLAGRKIAEVFDQFPELLVVAIIRKQEIQLPRGSSRLEAGDQLLIAANQRTSIEAFNKAIAEKKAVAETA